MTSTFQVGDEIEWRTTDENSTRVRGRVGDSGGVLAVRLYDDLRRLEDGFRSIPADTRLTSSTDLLAEIVPDVYHLLDDGTGPCRCGGLDRDGHRLRPLDNTVQHHAAVARARDVWSELIQNTARELDASDRSRPLEARALPEGSADQARDVRLCAECFRLAVLDACWPAEPVRTPEEDLRQFVLAWTGHQVYSHLHCPPNAMSVVFMCMSLMPPMPEDYIDKVGLIYEYMDRAGPRAINGQPTFFSHRVMHVDDWKRVRPVIEAEEDRRKNLKI